MPDVTRLLDAAAAGDPAAAAQLMPLVYDELRRLAASHLAREQPGQTLQATALVHEAYLRLLGPGREQGWNGRGHFFGAAAHAIRRILVDASRRKSAGKRGAGHRPLPLDHAASIAAPDAPPTDDLVALDQALCELAAEDPVKARLVELRYFAGLTIEDAAAALDISPATAKRFWVYARSWLYCRLTGD
jgi:RNA polymerase sigma factor (TIGR02999 family)